MSVLAPHAETVTHPEPAGKAAVDELYFKLTVAAAVFFVTLQLSYLIMLAVLPPDSWPDNTRYLLGRDFLNTWMGGRSMFSGGPAPWFDLGTFNEALRQLFGPGYPQSAWSYPPDLVLFIWPLGLMPYVPAYIAWCVVGVALYLLACSGAVARQRLVFLAVAPGVAVCLFFGQNGFYTAALLIGGMMCRERRPLLAGILFGILTVKPQLGLLVPVVLLLERRWLTIASALATTALLVTATSLLFGWSIWPEFWQKIVPQQVWLTETGDGLLYVMVGSVFYATRHWQLPLNVAWTLQYLTAALALAAVAWAFWRRRDPALSLALFVTATFLFTPYILNYDMVVFGFVVALLRDRSDNTEFDHGLLIAVWSLPITMMIGGLMFVPLAPIVLIAFACRLLTRLAQDRGREFLHGGSKRTALFVG